FLLSVVTSCIGIESFSSPSFSLKIFASHFNVNSMSILLGLNCLQSDFPIVKRIFFMTDLLICFMSFTSDQNDIIRIRTIDRLFNRLFAVNENVLIGLL